MLLAYHDICQNDFKACSYFLITFCDEQPYFCQWFYFILLQNFVFFYPLLFSLWGTAHIFVIFLILFSFSHIHPFFFKRSLEIRFQMPIVLKERPPYHQLPIKSAVFTSVTFVNLEKLLKVFQFIIYMEAQNVFLFRLQKLGTETGKSTSPLSLMLYFIKLKNMKNKNNLRNYCNAGPKYFIDNIYVSISCSVGNLYISLTIHGINIDE